MESPHCPQCGFLKGGVFCDPILGCYNMKVEMMLEREGTSAGDDFDPLDYHGKEVRTVNEARHEGQEGEGPCSLADWSSGFGDAVKI